MFGRQGYEAEGAEVGVGERHGERGAVAEAPRAMYASGVFGRQIVADAAASQLLVAGAPALPLLPGDGAQPSPGPLVECAQHGRSFAEAEVAAPSDEIARQLLGDLCEALSARARRELPDALLAAVDRLARTAAHRRAPAGEAEAQELAHAPVCASPSGGPPATQCVASACPRR